MAGKPGSIGTSRPLLPSSILGNQAYFGTQLKPTIHIDPAAVAERRVEDTIPPVPPSAPVLPRAPVSSDEPAVVPREPSKAGIRPLFGPRAGLNTPVRSANEPVVRSLPVSRPIAVQPPRVIPVQAPSRPVQREASAPISKPNYDLQPRNSSEYLDHIDPGPSKVPSGENLRVSDHASPVIEMHEIIYPVTKAISAITDWRDKEQLLHPTETKKPHEYRSSVPAGMEKALKSFSPRLIDDQQLIPRAVTRQPAAEKKPPAPKCPSPEPIAVPRVITNPSGTIRPVVPFRLPHFLAAAKRTGIPPKAFPFRPA